MDAQRLDSFHDVTDEGYPNGGSTFATGLSIHWQKGPLVDPDTGQRREPNGCFVETVIRAAVGRLEHYQASPFACDENAAALMHLHAALDALAARTRRRTTAGTEGTWQVDQ